MAGSVLNSIIADESHPLRRKNGTRSLMMGLAQSQSHSSCIYSVPSSKSPKFLNPVGIFDAEYGRHKLYEADDVGGGWEPFEDEDECQDLNPTTDTLYGLLPAGYPTEGPTYDQDPPPPTPTVRCATIPLFEETALKHASNAALTMSKEEYVHGTACRNSKFAGGARRS
ncbi:hypothetical protein B0H19DRAFT_1271722 [Mycena capillaripes]|nr:hypothetical protein B0H19DRAFT_1271722 [Mycena capillaripes]